MVFAERIKGIVGSTSTAGKDVSMLLNKLTKAAAESVEVKL